MRRSIEEWICVALLGLLCAGPALMADDAAAKPFVHPLFSSNMVLQRGIPDPIWGWTEPGTAVTVSLSGTNTTAHSNSSVSASATVTAGADGKWMAKLGPFEAGGPYEMTVSAGAKQEKLNNVLIGDVWLCSGQSNMSMGVGVSKDGKEEIASADHPQLRLYSVPNIIGLQPQETLPAGTSWSVCSPKTLGENGWGGFSAAAYFFGRDLQKELNIPIGLIHSSWGGTICEAWISSEALEKGMPEFRDAVAAEHAQSAPSAKESYPANMQEWYAKADPGTPAGWQQPDAGDADWKTMKLPAVWEQANVGMDNFDGVVWFRKTIDIPPLFVGKKLVLHLGAIDDRDTTWVNGKFVGAMELYNQPRNYDVPETATQNAKITIAVRVLDTGGNGGIWGQPTDMRLEAPGSGVPAIDLSGDWKFKASADLKKAVPLPGMPSSNPNVVTVLYNGMIHPLIPFGIKGAIWYQGESNAGRGMQYRKLLPTMIQDWRSRFGVGDFPFFVVQLANFMETKPQPTDSAWAELREAQAIAAGNAGNSAIASAIDVGEAGDIHPKNKQAVGHRLALDALAIVYGKPIEYSGPEFKNMEKKESTILLHFTHADGLQAKGGVLKGFAIAGADHHFIWADAKIEGDSVIVSSSQVSDPAAVRYDWADNPEGTLYNAAGLPATPFRTDSPE